MSRFGALALLAALLFSCDQSANRVSTLWTNVPEIAAAVERFNASQREWQLLVEYREDPAALLTGPGVKADLVVARGLSSAAVKDTMVPLDFLFDGGNVAKASFYQRILEAGQQGDRLKVLPLSFDLPVLLYSKAVLPDLPGFSLAIAELKKRNKDFDAQTSGLRQSKLAFSPRWDSFGPTFLQWSGAAFQEGFQGNLSWNVSALREALESLRTWSSPGWNQAASFQQKYLQTDPTPALTAGRVQFYPSTLAAFLNRPWQERRDLDFRFLDQGGRVLASDGTVWAGIPSSSLTRGAGERFLAWFLLNETQSRLIRQAQTADERNFGLIQGISSLVAANSGALVDAYPELAGRLPAQDQIAFWPALPPDWTSLKSSVIKPWLDSPDATSEALQEALDQQRSQAARR